MTQNHTCLVRYTKPYVTQETSAEYLLNKINMYPILIPLHSLSSQQNYNARYKFIIKSKYVLNNYR